MNDCAKLEGEAAEVFILAGHAIFTLVSTRTRQRFTYRVRRPSRRADGRPMPVDVRFVDVLVGPNNSNDYQFAGTICGRSFRPSSKARISADSPSVKAFAWYWAHVGDPRVEVWHEGRCGRCGRRLTTPESLSVGVGPECLSRVA